MAISSNPNAVSLPSGQTASFEELYAYGCVLQAFIREQEVLLPAVADTKRHNDTIDYLQALANGYNEQVRIYKIKEALQQNALTVALLCPVNS